MKGLKSKVIIAIIMILSLVLGYQASVMANATDGCDATFWRASAVPFWSNGHFILCREHNNSWKDAMYVCRSEYHINQDGEIKEGAAHGMAYFLHFGSKYGVGAGYGNEIQGWMWRTYSNFWNGANIFSSGSNYPSFFSGAQVNATEIESFLNVGANTNNKIDYGAILDETTQIYELKEALDSKMIPVVDNYPDKFFTTESKENDKRITEISAEEYNYLYQLSSILAYIDEHLGDANLESNLGEYVKTYRSELGANIYDKEILPTEGFVRSYETKDFYNSAIKLTEFDTNGDNTVDEYMWQYLDGEGNLAETIYYSNLHEQFGTTKFSDRVLLNKDSAMLANYIKLYKNNGYSIDNLINDLKAYNEKPDKKDLPTKEDLGLTDEQYQKEISNYTVEFDKLANKLKETCSGKSGEELSNEVSALLNQYNSKIIAIAETTTTEENVTNATVNNNGSGRFTFSGSTAQAARVYQWLANQNIFEKCANRFGINTSNAKVSIDRNNKQYIMGPFSTDYFSIEINGEKFMELQQFNVLLQLDDTEILLTQDENGKKYYSLLEKDKVVLTKEFIDTPNPYNLITGGDKLQPDSGEAFYIQLSQAALEKIIKDTDIGISDRTDYFLTNNDKLGAQVTYKYVKCISATIHFLQGQTTDGHDDTKYNTAHSQRLMTFDTQLYTDTITKQAYINPETYEFEVIKVDQEGNRLEGAEFALFGRYQSTEDISKEIYMDLKTNETFEGECKEIIQYGETIKTFTVLNNAKGNYGTGDNGRIGISNVPNHIVYNDKEYTLYSVVGKETKAPENATIYTGHFEMIKQDNQISSITRENVVIKPYDIKIKKVDEKGEPIPNITFKYDILGGSNKGDSSKTGEIITGPDGTATIEDVKVYCDDLYKYIYLELREEETEDYKYFESIRLIYIPKIDEDRNVTLEFVNFEPYAKNMPVSSWVSSEVKSNGIVNGIVELTGKDNITLYANKASEYIKCGDKASNNIDIQIKNEEERVPYNLELFKYDESGNTSKYLDGTKFKVEIVEVINQEFPIKHDVEIKDGKAIIENVGVYGENIIVYLTETVSKDGFKTVLDKPKAVVMYNANKKGELELTYTNENVLNPVNIEKDGYKSVDVVQNTDKQTMSLRLGIINETEEYSLKFRKTDPEGNPLQGATFTLAEKGENGELVAIGTDTSDEDGYMIFKGLTKTGDVTLYLYEESAPEGYLSIATKENPLMITYKYEPGSGKLTNFVVKHNGEKLEEDIPTEIDIEKDTAGNIGTLNSIFDLVNTPKYDLELFTKVDKNGNPIKDMKFNVAITWINENKEERTTSMRVESDEYGKVIFPEVDDYGNLKISVSEIEVKDSASENYEIIKDTLKFSCTTTPGNDPVWSDEVIVVKEDGSEQRYHVKEKVLVDDNGDKYSYIEIEEYGPVKYKVINDEKPYNLVIKKVNSVDGTAIPNVEFTATVFKNGTSERQTFEGLTNEKGEIVLEGITIYNNADDNTYTDRLSVSITETVPEGYKWHEYGQVTYTQDYLKYSANGDIEPLTGLVTARVKDEDGNPAIKFLAKDVAIIEEKASEKSHEVEIRNTPVYDLDLFDMKAIVTNSELQQIIEKDEIDFSDVLANGGIKFTAEVKDANNNLVQSNVKVTFDDNGIVAHDIDTSSLFTNNTTEVKGLKLVLTEVQTNGLVKIDPITIVYDCEYVDRKFETTKTGYQYQEKLYDLKDLENTNVEVVKDLIYIDNEGKHVLVNIDISKLILVKYDEQGNAISGVTFEGTVSNAQGSQQFNVTTGEAGIDGEAVIENITLTGEVTVVITDEYWKDGKMPEGMNYSELEFIKGDITISGIVINEDGTFDYSKATVDDAHKDQVKINKSIMAIEVTNKNLTYDIPMIKTSETDEPLDKIIFNFIIKDEGAEDNADDNLYFNNVETKTDGRMDLTKINKFGDLVLVIEEANSNSKHSNYKMLKDKVYVHYTATPNYETNKVDIAIKDIKYENGTDASEDVKKLTDENGKFIGIQVINHHEYSITLHKVMNVNDKIEEPNEKVTLKGLVTTEAEVVDEVANMSYKDFKDYIDNKSNTEKTLYFNQETTKKSIVKIDGLDEFDDRVYVYFIEELQENSSMTLIEEVLNVSFIHEVADSEKIAEGQKDKLSFDKNSLDVKVTIKNDAEAYNIDFLKVDSKGNPVASLANSQFKFVLKEKEGKATKDVDTAIIKLDDDGQINYNKSTKGEKYIVDFRLTEDGYIQLDINKFGNLQLEIEELVAPDHYIKNENTFVIPYTAEPGKVTIGDGVSEGLIVNENSIGIEVKLPNDEESYDLPIYKVLKQDIKHEEGEKASNITFDVKFFEKLEDGTMEPIMQNLYNKYITEGGFFIVPEINKYGEYYIALEEIDTGNTNIKPIPGIHVFKITAKAEDTVDEKGNVNKNAVKSIEYMGTGEFDTQGNFMIKGNTDYAEYFRTSKTDKSTGTSIARLEITNKKPVPYTLDLYKYFKGNTDNPLNGVEFEAYLTKENEDYKEGAINLLGEKIEDYTRVTGEGENVKDGQIIFSDLELYGTYKLTLVETKWPVNIKQTFDKIEIIYSTENGKDITVNSTKVYFEGKEISSDNIVKATSNKASIGININNIEENPVPLYIYKVKYTDVRNEKGELVKQAVPVAGAMFSGTVTAEGEEPQPFNNKKSDEDGKVDLGKFYIDGEVKVHIEEIVAPAGAGKIPATDIKINVNNNEQKVDSNNWSATTNAVEGIENNTFKIIDPETVNPYITLAGMVWEDVKQGNKGNEVISDGTNFIEGLYDVGYDRPMEGVKVILHQEGSKKTYETVTNDAGQYVFEKLNPFGKYYITFDYANKEDQEKQYESVKYLVQVVQDSKEPKYIEYTGELKNALEKAIQNNTDGESNEDIWARNSKAVTDYSKDKALSTATTTQTSLAIGEEKAKIQYYPVQDMFTIDDEKVDLYYNKSNGKYYTKGVEDSYYDKENGKYISDELEKEFKDTFIVVTYSPLNPSHQCINLGLKLKATFDLSLTKDVEKIAAYVNGVSMNWKYGAKPDSAMYQLELTQADIENLEELYITYKIEIVNEGETAGKLEQIADYYNSNLLKLEGVYYTKNDNLEFNEEKLTEFDTPDQIEDNTQHMYHDKPQNMIPVQTYSSETGKTDKSTAAQTGQVMININTEDQNVDPGEKFVIYIKYEYDLKNNNPLTQDGKVKAEGSEYVTLGIAEIIDSISTNKMEEKDSDENSLSRKFNTVKDFKNFYEDDGDDAYYTELNNPEDDEDTAPAVKIIVGESGRTVSGNVFEDTDGDKIFDFDEDGVIKGITVNLYNEKDRESVENRLKVEAGGSLEAGETVETVVPVQTVETNENGEYKFTEIPAGTYFITFTYGDEKTVVPKLKKVDESGRKQDVTGEVQISDDEDPYPRNNWKSYNAFEFKSVDQATNEGLYWYNSEVRGSDATDDSDLRTAADNAMKKKINSDTMISVMDNELAEKMNAYKADFGEYSKAKEYVKDLASHSVTALTPKFQLNIEPTTGDTVQYTNTVDDTAQADKIITQYQPVNDDKIVAPPTNIDFGIEAREQSKLIVEKVVDSIKITKSDGVRIIDAKFNSETGKVEGTAPIIKWSPENKWIQLAEEEIIGAELEVTYKITVKDDSKEHNGETIVVTVADYIQNEIAYIADKNESNGWNLAIAKDDNKSTLILIDEKEQQKENTISVKINNKIDLTTRNTIAIQDFELNKENEYTLSKNITLSTKLSDFNAMPEFENYVEVIQTAVRGDLARKDQDSIPGNYDPSKKTTIEGNIGIVTEIDKTGLEKDTSKAEFGVSPETGENRATYYILAISLITVFAVGIILIKKKVLDR